MKKRLIWIVALAVVSPALASLYFYTGNTPSISFGDLLTQSHAAFRKSVQQYQDYNPVHASLYGMPGRNSGRWNIIFVNRAQRSYNVNTLFPEMQTRVDLYSSNDLYNIYTDADMVSSYAKATTMLTPIQQSDFYCCGVHYDTKEGGFLFEFAAATNWKNRLIVNAHSVTNRTL